MFMTILYCIMSVLWGIYAFKQQRRCYPETGIIKYVCSVALNILIAPICIMIAIIREK